MTAANVIRLLLELDQFILSPRPSLYGEAAEAVRALCNRADAEADLGDYEAIDMSAVVNDAPWTPDTPILDGALRAAVLRTANRQGYDA
jgi:hypothetical protein